MCILTVFTAPYPGEASAPSSDPGWPVLYSHGGLAARAVTNRRRRLDVNVPPGGESGSKDWKDHQEHLERFQ